MIYKSDSETLCKAIPSRLGACSLFESDVNYWDGAEDAEPKIKTGFIGGENLYFDENFGCIHFEKY